MSSPMRRRVAGSLALCQCALVLGGAAQSAPRPGRSHWGVGITVGVHSYGTAARGITAEGQALRFFPYRTTMGGLAAQFGGERLRVLGAVRYGEPGLAARGVPLGEDADASGLVVADNAYHLTEFVAGLSSRLLRLRGGPALRPSLAAELQRWTGAGSPSRMVLGGSAGLALEVSVTAALSVSLAGEVGLLPASPFRKEDLPEHFDPQQTWRRSLAAGLWWRF